MTEPKSKKPPALAQWKWSEIDAGLPTGLSGIPLMLSTAALPFGGVPQGFIDRVRRVCSSRARVRLIVQIEGEDETGVEIS